jgi:riboflavin synthase
MLWLIPHTLEKTIIGHYQTGTKVNLEVDVIARYLERLMQGKQTEEKSDISMAFLAENGYLNRK